MKKSDSTSNSATLPNQNSSQQTNHAIIILASGLSRRLGQAKQLLFKNGVPLISHMIRLAASTNPQLIIVVIPKNKASIDSEVAKLSDTHLNVKIAINQTPETGMGHSLYTAIEALTYFVSNKNFNDKDFNHEVVERVLIIGVDQVLLNLEHVNELLAGKHLVAASAYEPWQLLDTLAKNGHIERKAEVKNETKNPIVGLPSSANWLGTDDRGRDLLAQLLYGFRVSVLFALALTAVGVALGVVTGAIQGFFGGKTDLAFQRFIEIWGSMPELYLLIIFSAVLAPSISLLLVLLSLFGWMGLSDYVRAEFLRNRQLDYVKAARALGVPNRQIIWRHILPNSLTPVVTFLPFRMSAAILALTSLDFLGLGVPPGTPSLGELLSQGKNSIDAWWISLGTFTVLVTTLLLLTFMGDALRDALDPRKVQVTDAKEGA